MDKYRLVIRQRHLDKWLDAVIILTIERQYENTWVVNFSKKIRSYHVLKNLKHYLLNKTFNIEYHNHYFYQFYTQINEEEYTEIRKIINAYKKNKYKFPNIEETGAVVDLQKSYLEKRVPYIHLHLYIKHTDILITDTRHKYHAKFFDEFFKDKPFKLCAEKRHCNDTFTYYTPLTDKEVFALAYIFKKPLNKKQVENYLQRLHNDRDSLMEELAAKYISTL